MRHLHVVAIAVGALVQCSVSLNAADITIEIQGDDDDALYIQTDPKPPYPGRQHNVIVTVGQSVQWVNKGNKAHTATSDLKVGSGATKAYLFDTDQIEAGATSAARTFAQADYDKARVALGLDDGDPLPLGYFCTNHPGTMGGKLLLIKTESLKAKFLKSGKAK